MRLPYGTPEIANTVYNLIASRGSHSGIFWMLGHEDGIVSHENRAKAAGILLIDTLVLALSFE